MKTDIGCDDFEKAEYNRYIIKNRLFTTGYQLVEDWFAHSPLNSPLPDWMPRGKLTQVGKKEWKQHQFQSGEEWVEVDTTD